VASVAFVLLGGRVDGVGSFWSVRHRTGNWRRGEAERPPFSARTNKTDDVFIFIFQSSEISNRSVVTFIVVACRVQTTIEVSDHAVAICSADIQSCSQSGRRT
jgi:hypothetical protein